LFNESLLEGAYDIGDNSITIVKGANFESADEDSVFALTVETLHRALQERTHLSVDYTPDAADSEIIDLTALYNVISREPVSAVYDPETFSATESVVGISFDMALATTQLTNARAGERVVIPLIFIDPEVTTEYLQSVLFRDVLAQRNTNIAGTANRLNNIVLAAAEIHEVVLNPGDVFSFNQIVGRRTTARGFREAGGFQDGQLVNMVGGGICQVSSTLYDNVLHAYLEVIERRAHSLPIAYLPLGHDAAISYGQLDLRFRNNTPYPIRIEINIDGRSMTSRLVGTRTNDYTVRIESSASSTPYQTVERVDPSLAYGATAVVYSRGQNGAVARTYRVVLNAAGNEVSRTFIARDVYRAQNRIVLVPSPDAQPPLADPEPPLSPDDPIPPSDPTPPTETEPPADPIPPDPPPPEPPVDPPADPPPQIPTEPPADAE